MYICKQYWRFTQLDLELKFDAVNNPEGRKRVDFLIKNSKFFPHPDFPKQKELRMYRVLLSMIDGSKKASQNTSSLDVNGGVANPESATALMEAQQKQEALSTQFTDDATEGDVIEPKIQNKRQRKELTHEQQVEKQAVDRLKKMEKRINDLKLKLNSNVLKLESLPKPDAAGIVVQATVLKAFHDPLDKHAKIVHGISVSKAYEELGKKLKNK